MYAASAIAGNTVCRSALAAVAPLWTEQMFSALGVGGAGSLIGGVACLLAPIPFLFYKYGNRIRQRSKFAPTQTTKPVNQCEEQSRPASQHAESSSDDEPALDGEADVSNTNLEKKASDESAGHDAENNGDRYLDADGMEKAEKQA